MPSGTSTIVQRKIIVEENRKSLVEKLNSVQSSIDYIDWKQ